MSSLRRRRRSRLLRRTKRAPSIQPMKDFYDGEPWTEMDLRDLEAALRIGSTIEDAAHYLCRSGTVDDVRRKAEELGLKYRVAFRRNAQPRMFRWRISIFGKTPATRFGAVMAPDEETAKQKAIAFHGIPSAEQFRVVAVKIEEAKKEAAKS